MKHKNKNKNKNSKYKYKKYKTKYNKLQKYIDQHASGDKKIFDLSEYKQYKFTDDVQKNLRQLEKTFGKSFTIKWDKIIFPVILHTKTFKSNDVTFYEIYYDMPNRIHDLKPFSIMFIDNKTLELGNASYIANIHRTYNISGSQMMYFVLELQRVLGVEKTILHDGATVNCDGSRMNLSYIKLLEKGKTFYMKFGFEYEIDKSGWFVMRYKNEKEYKKDLDNTIAKIKKIKIDDIIKDYEDILDILVETTKTGDYRNFNIKFVTETEFKNHDYYYADDPYFAIPDIFRDTFNILHILNGSKDKYFYEFFIKLFNDTVRCHDYLILKKIIADSIIYSIESKNKTAKFKYTPIFNRFSSLKRISSYVYHFT